MSNFRTPVPELLYPIQVRHKNPTLCIGSCFAEEVANRLKEYQFETSVNPTGIAHNPISVCETLKTLYEDKSFSETDLFQHNDLWHSFAHHSEFSHPDKEVALQNMNNSVKQGHQFLNKCDRMIITWGTANIYVHAEKRKVVANCHKLPSYNFVKRRLGEEEIVQTFSSACSALKSKNPDLQIILTVSPVRHLKDGFTENQRSKSTLLLAAEQLSQKFDFVHYFPSYEIMMDDLRDYRFYKADMVHPNAEAMDYIWNNFKHSFIDLDTLEILKSIEKLNKASTHKPFHPNTATHQAFVQTQLEAIAKLEEKYEHLNLSSLAQSFKEQMATVEESSLQ